MNEVHKTMRGAACRSAGRNVAMPMSSNGEVKYAQNGLAIIVK